MARGVRPDGTARRDDTPRAMERLAARAVHRRERETRLGLGEALALAEGRAPLGVGRVDQMAVALDVAVLAADDEDDRVLLERIRELARRRRLAVEEAARAELAGLTLDLDDYLPAVDEVQLVLLVVVVLEALVARRVDDRVHAEGGDAERAADLAEAVTVAELVEGGEARAHAEQAGDVSASGSRPSSSPS